MSLVYRHRWHVFHIIPQWCTPLQFWLITDPWTMLAEWISHNTVREFSLNDRKEHNASHAITPTRGMGNARMSSKEMDIDRAAPWTTGILLTSLPVLWSSFKYATFKSVLSAVKKKKKLIWESLGRVCEFKWVDSQPGKPSFFWSVRERREGKVISPWKPKGPPSTQNGPKAYSLEKPLEL